jgi:putative hydrolase of the HAD superfamily
MIFFDLDDTLLDHETAAKAGAADFFKTYRSSFAEELESFLKRWDSVAEKYFQSNSPVQYSLLEQRRMRVRDLFSTTLTDDEADARFEIYLDTYEASWKLYPDAIPCLQALQGHPLGLITNGEGEQQRLKIENLGLGSYFTTVIISREVNCAKPDKAIYELAARQAGVDIGDCFYIGDRLQVDAIASQKAGMKGIWLDRKGSGTDKNIAVPVLRNLSELPKVLR